MRERGSAMLMAVFAVMMLFLISGISFSFVINKYKLETSEEKILKAYSIAESGINSQVADVLKAIDDKRSSINVNDPVDNSALLAELMTPGNWEPSNTTPFGTEEGSYTITHVYIDPNCTSVTVTAEGMYMNVKRTLTQQYAIQVI